MDRDFWLVKHILMSGLRMEYPRLDPHDLLSVHFPSMPDSLVDREAGADEGVTLPVLGVKMLTTIESLITSALTC